MKSIKEMLTDAEYINTGVKERLVSATAGITLVTMGIKDFNKSSPKTWIELAAGAILLFRGVSGYCPVNKALGRDTRNTDEKFDSLAEA